MIAPMKKAFVLVSDRSRDPASKKLRALGLVHVEPLEGRGERFTGLSDEKHAVEKALGALSEAKTKEAQATGRLPRTEALDLARGLEAALDEIKRRTDEIGALTREIERVEPWGDFEPSLFAELETAGITVRLVELSEKRLKALPPEQDYITLGTSKGVARVALFAPKDEILPPEFVEFAPPEKSLGALFDERAAHGREIGELRSAIAGHATDRARLEAALKDIEADLALETVRSGMENDGPVAWLSGWIPMKEADKLEKLAAAEGWGLLLDEPQGDELPPTKLENNAAVRIVQPIFDFLGVVPNYREYDVSGLFLFFLTVFFAMIFGDGGYGSVMLVAGIAAAIASKRKTGTVSDPVRLLLLLAGATVAWGVLTASWFGIRAENLPPVLLAIANPFVSNANPQASDNVKLICFCLGLVQLAIAHFKNIVRDIKSPKFIAQIGQLAMIYGIFWLVLNMVISSTRFPMPEWAIPVTLAGFALNFLFANYDGSAGFVKGMIGSVIASFANIVSVFLGVVNVFADLVSYIRLWAVGLAGVGISDTVNSMAGPMVGKLSLYLVAGSLLLGFGHGLNIILSVLSVIVHGVRLNMLEFSGHLGMEWSGYKYEPFKEPVQSGRADDERSHT